MRVQHLLLALAALVFSLSLVQAAPETARQDIVRGLETLVRQRASFTEINRYLDRRHEVVEDFCPTAPEHRDCLQRPAVAFQAWQSDAVRVLSYVLRMEPASGTIHLSLICRRPGTSAVRLQPVSPGGAHLAASIGQVQCGAQNDEVELNLIQSGDFRFGAMDAGTAKELIVEFPG